MRFIFVESFGLTWNGRTARHNDGISGSHNALMYLAESLASYNHEVLFTSIHNHLIEETYLGVHYINRSNFTYTSCDYIITANNMDTLSIVESVTEFRKIIILTQNDLCCIDPLFSIDASKILIAYISEFAKRNILEVQPFLQRYDSMLLYNSIDRLDLPDFKVSEKERALCFFPCVERGFKITAEVLKNLDQYILYTNTYYEPFRNGLKSIPHVIVPENSSKYTTLDHVKRSKYFVYPLINVDNHCIHYDTFAYVVLEALLLGTIVITPRIGVFEELYGDAICYIDTSDIIPEDDLLRWKKHNPNFGYPTVQRYVDMIHRLDQDETLRNDFIQKGIALTSRFDHKILGKRLLDTLSNKE